MEKRIQRIYQKLYDAFGQQNWWPAESQFEVIVGAILTQQTNWKNVEKAIKNLKKEDLLSSLGIHEASYEHLAKIIKPCGFYNIKAKRLKNFVDYFIKNYEGKLTNFSYKSTGVIRNELLKINGLGKETVDSILLYALDRDVFVVDTYTLRLFERYGVLEKPDYENAKMLIEGSFKENTERVNVFKEFHALIVELGKKYCRKKPLCANCPLAEECIKKGVIYEQSRIEKV